MAGLPLDKETQRPENLSPSARAVDDRDTPPPTWTCKPGEPPQFESERPHFSPPFRWAARVEFAKALIFPCPYFDPPSGHAAISSSASTSFDTSGAGCCSSG